VRSRPTNGQTRLTSVIDGWTGWLQQRPRPRQPGLPHWQPETLSVPVPLLAVGYSGCSQPARRLPLVPKPARLHAEQLGGLLPLAPTD
jgi:hypothetical protein